jgi:hypothetical protein
MRRYTVARLKAVIRITSAMRKNAGAVVMAFAASMPDLSPSPESLVDM